MQKEAIAVYLKAGTYVDLAMQLRRLGDHREPEEIIAVAVRYWLAATGHSRQRGYQWKELFLPEGSELRLRYRGVDYFAAVEGDQLLYQGDSVSPRLWTQMVTGTVRNPWRDVWVRRSVNEAWTHAGVWRSRHSVQSARYFIDRRRNVRRSSDL